MSDLRTNMAASDIEGADVILQLNKIAAYVQSLLGTSSPVYRAVNAAILPVGGSYAIPDVTVAAVHFLTFGAGNCTFTFPLAAAGKSFVAELKQDGVGSRLATWPTNATVRFPANTPPVLSTGAGKSDMLRFECFDGVHWDGYVEAANI